MGSVPEWLGPLEESEDTFRNEGLVLREGAWTIKTISSRPGSVRLCSNLFDPVLFYGGYSGQRCFRKLGIIGDW